jgi:hypothetical protein
MGAYCYRVALTGGTADATVKDNDGNITLTTNNFFAFEIYFSGDFSGTANDTFNLFEAQSTSSVAEITVSGRIVAATGVINLGIGKTAATSWSAMEIQRNTWYTVEIDTTPATGSAGTMDVYITRRGDPATVLISAAQVGSVTNLAVTHVVLGVQDHAATTTGVILFDRLIQDDGRIYPPTDVFSPEVVMQKSGHAFVGQGSIWNVTLLSGAGADNVLRLFDTDIADTTDESNVRLELKNTANSETVDPAGTPVNFTRGCYVDLAGTNPRAIVQIKHAQDRSYSGIRRLGLIHGGRVA